MAMSSQANTSCQSLNSQLKMMYCKGCKRTIH